MRLGLLIGFTLLMFGGIFSQGSYSIKSDDGFGPPHVGTCTGGRNCGMQLVIDNTVVWEAVP